MATKHIFITGGNAGIGFALCKLLVGEREDTFVFLGSRDAEKGAAAVKSISDAYPAAADRIALVAIDVGDEASVAAAAAALQAKSVTLYALVNNAGVGFQTSPGDAAALLNVNLLGPKRVSEAILPLIDPAAGRIVNVSSGAASMWLRSQSAETKERLTQRHNPGPRNRTVTVRHATRGPREGKQKPRSVHAKTQPRAQDAQAQTAEKGETATTVEVGTESQKGDCDDGL